MFVKFVRSDHTAIYECDRVFAKTLINGRSKTVLLTIVGGKEEQLELEIEKGVQVFIMNSEGKTIDRYR